jgi:LmbE family N-acetylglucosaminyl deacetylase
MDGELDQIDPRRIIPELATHICRIRPDVVVTFDPFGVYGHPDHIAISQFTTSAILSAASPENSQRSGYPPHQISKLYYLSETDRRLSRYEDAFGELIMPVDGVDRRATGWPEWSITTRIDTSDYYGQVWQAVYCHKSQLPGFQALLDLPDDQCATFFSETTLYRAFSLVNGGRQLERDIFAGLR